MTSALPASQLASPPPDAPAPGRRNRRIGAAAAAALFGLLTGWWTPRGPVTTPQALATIGGSLLVGAFAGRVMRTRWAMLLAPAVFVAVFELVRINTTGPLVDGIHLGSTLGIIAFVLGRGLHGVLAVVPMLLGITFGAAVARRLDGTGRARHGWSRAGLWTRRGLTALVTVGMVALSLAIVRPASTDPILGTDGRPLPGSIAELTRVEVGGHSLAMMIRGRSTTNPVLLFLAGGPGAGEMGAMRRHGQALEQEFTVVTLDQRGAGKSYDQLDPISTLTLDGAVSDAVGVTNYLRHATRLPPRRARGGAAARPRRGPSRWPPWPTRRRRTRKAVGGCQTATASMVLPVAWARKRAQRSACWDGSDPSIPPPTTIRSGAEAGAGCSTLTVALLRRLSWELSSPSGIGQARVGLVAPAQCRYGIPVAAQAPSWANRRRAAPSRRGRPPGLWGRAP